ncbi:molecular chaperone [Capsulimonas corticalis]|uniref:Molecular chaperone n=1 Tax=Capsulimonas corticalis TaxID=2219043 RepID=A0A402CNS5_9BACT|nr:Hsp20/alpha crystallin family protein [Capsulimonas corticalis]BDI33247.1 molecular chaperone [Capsulimonas corticalis]
MANIVRFDPFEDLNRLQREVNRLFEDNSRSGRGTETAAARTWAPSVDILEDGNEIVVIADLPGLRQEDIDIELTGETLTIKGERKFEDTQRKDRYVRVERSYGTFQRSFTIVAPVQHDGVKASYKDGILEVHLPKSEETKPKKVQVSAG